MNTMNIIAQENPSEENIDITEAKNSPIYSLDEGLRIARILQYPLMLKHPILVATTECFVVYHQNEFIEYLRNSPISQSTPLLLETLNNEAISEPTTDALKMKEKIKQHCKKIAIEIARLD